MKFHTLAVAAALVFGGAAFAAPNDSAKAPATPQATSSVKMKHHAVRHAKKHHRAMTAAKRHHAHDNMAFSKAEPTNASRESRMDEALRKFRTSHS